MSVALTELGPGALLATRRPSAAEPERVLRLREQAQGHFAASGLPTIRQEAWRFTNVAALGRLALEAAAPGAKLDPKEITSRAWPEATTVVVVDGQFRPELSGALPAGVEVLSLSAALASNHPVVSAELGRLVDTAVHPFGALNTALFGDGIAFLVAAHAVVEQPIQILCFSSEPSATATAAFPRILIVVGENAQAKVVEYWIGLGRGARLVAAVEEMVVAAGAVFEHARVQDETDDTFLLTVQKLEIARSANVASRTFTFGGGIVRNDVGAALRGEGVACALDGLYVTRDQQLVDNHMVVDHIAPHCDSHELFKGILDGRSRAVFNGLLHVHPGAQKTDAKQTNRNLLLSSEALVNTNPQLEIYADDVKCTHGSTVGELDPEAVFYLRSRGIGETEARGLLTWAFAREIVDHVGIAPLVVELEERLIRRLPSAEVLRQAGR